MANTTSRQGPEASPGAARLGVAAAREERTAAVGDPIPLGLTAFATSVLTAGTVLAGWWPRPAFQLAAIVPLLIVFGGLTQFVAAMWSYGRAETLAGTFFGAFGSFFVGVGIYRLVLGGAALGPTQQVLGPLGVALACFAFIALLIAIGSVPTNVGLSATSMLLTGGLIVLAWSFFWQGNAVLNALSGWFGIVSGAVAFLTAAAMIVGFEGSRLLTPSLRPWRPTTA